MSMGSKDAQREKWIRLNTHNNMVENLVWIHGTEMAEKLAEIVMYTGNFRGWTQYRKTMKNENMTTTFEHKHK